MQKGKQFIAAFQFAVRESLTHQLYSQQRPQNPDKNCKNNSIIIIGSAACFEFFERI